MENDTPVWTSDTIREMDPAEMIGILIYTDTPRSRPITRYVPLGWPVGPVQ